jgi:membrane protein
MRGRWYAGASVSMSNAEVYRADGAFPDAPSSGYRGAMIDRVKALAARLSRSLPGRVVQKFLADRGPQHAVLIAWNALFSLFPIVLALAAIAGAVLSLAGVGQQQVETTIASAIPDPSAASSISKAVRGVQQHSGLLGLIALVGFLWSASSLFGTLEQSLGEILDAPPRDFVRSKLMSLLMMLIFVVLLCVGIASSTVVSVISQLPIPQPGFVQRGSSWVIQTLVGILAGFLLFFAIYYVVPNRRMSARHVWPGAVLAGVGFELLTLLFPLYLSFNKGVNQYGSTFALLFILLTFLYFLGLVTVLGAELISVLEPEREALSPDHSKAPERPRRLKWVYGLAGTGLALVLAVRHRDRR